MSNITIISLDFYHSSYHMKIQETENFWNDTDLFIAETQFPYGQSVRFLSYEPDRNYYVIELKSGEVYIGSDNPIAQWITDNLEQLKAIVSSQNPPEVVITVEMVRVQKLYETDWVLQRHQEETLLGIANTLTSEKLSEVMTYRQALRDITNTNDKNLPADQITWPVNPLEQ